MRNVASLVCLLFALSIAHPAEASIPAAERDALVALYNAAGGAQWSDKTNWLGAAGTECSWFGVTCDTGQTSVLELNLYSNNLTGALPSQLTQLTNLYRLDVSDNQLSGPIPTFVLGMSRLTDVYFDFNRFTGTIPPQFGSMPFLRGLGFGSNPLGGTIPVELTNLTNLSFLSVGGTCREGDPTLTGTIPSAIWGMTSLHYLEVYCSAITGTIPPEVARLSNLEVLDLDYNNLTGIIPSEIGQLHSLRYLDLSGNQLTGTIPPVIWQLTNLETLGLGNNQLTGEIPPEVRNLTKLKNAWLLLNRFSGSIPTEFAQLTNLKQLYLNYNEFTGTLPDFRTLTNLQVITVRQNHLTGPFPLWVTQLTTLRLLGLGGNEFEGPVPAALGNLTNLSTLLIEANRFSGALPSSLLNLSKLTVGGSDFRFNRTSTTDSSLNAFLDTKQTGGPGWLATQTLAPTGVSVTATTQESATLQWTPIAYRGDGGGYQVLVATTPGGPYQTAFTTADKNASGATVTGLTPNTHYYFVVRTFTAPHTYPSVNIGVIDRQTSTLTSDPSAEVNATTQPVVIKPADVVVTGLPAALVQDAGAGGAATSYTLRNVGEAGTAITLIQTGDFFTQSPLSFSLAAGASQTITITGKPMPAGVYEGASVPSGTGVPSALSVPVRMLVAPPPSGNVVAQTSQNRVDVAAAAGTNPTGTASFTNSGTGVLSGVLVSDVPWLIPQSGLITIQPGQTVTVTFQIDETKRSESVGSVTGTLSLVYRVGAAGPFLRVGPSDGASGTATINVTVVSTTQPKVAPGTLPDLAPGEVALFLPGVGHVSGTVGTFISDLSIANGAVAGVLQDIKLYYNSTAAPDTAQIASLDRLVAAQPVAFGDLIKSVYGTESQGTLQIRAKDVDKVAVSAVVFNSTNPKGTYGTAVPRFRSDRSAGPGQQMFITGLRRTATMHTNYYLQEVTGSSANVVAEYFDASGNSLGSRPDTVQRFSLRALGSIFPEGTVSAVITNQSDSAGRIVAYATPVDRASGDTWAVTDWSLQGGYASNEAIVIPSAGSVHGANATYFRNDIAVFNTSPVRATASLRYYARGGGAPVVREITLDPRQSLVSDDLIHDVLGITTDTVGFVIVVPLNGSFAVNSRNYTTAGTATLGTAVPSRALSSSLRPGQMIRIAGLDDAALSTIVAQRPATFRTNFAMVETAGQPATVKVTVSCAGAVGKVSSRVEGSKQYQLAPYQFVLLGPLVREVLGPDRETVFGDLRNVEVTFQVQGDSGAVTVFTTSVDNGTGDSILRIE